MDGIFQLSFGHGEDVAPISDFLRVVDVNPLSVVRVVNSGKVMVEARDHARAERLCRALRKKPERGVPWPDDLLRRTLP